MTYEELYYRSMTDHELQRVIDENHLDGYANRCKQELIRRKEEQNEITRL